MSGWEQDDVMVGVARLRPADLAVGAGSSPAGAHRRPALIVGDLATRPPPST